MKMIYFLKKQITILSLCVNIYNVTYHTLYDNAIQDGRQKGPPTSFPAVTSTNVGTSHQNFLTFSFNSFATLV